MVGNVGTLSRKTLLYRSGVTQHLRNGGPVEMISIEKLIKNMVLLDQFSNKMLN